MLIWTKILSPIRHIMEAKFGRKYKTNYVLKEIWKKCAMKNEVLIGFSVDFKLVSTLKCQNYTSILIKMPLIYILM